MLWKTYVDRGRGLTSYFNELFLLFGFWQISAKKNPLFLVLTIVIYGFMCLLIGWLWFHFGWEESSAEVNNQYNLFQKQMRDKLDIEQTWKQKQS